MEYTLEQLLNDGILEQWEPITDGIDYGSIAVRSISVQELPMAPFIAPGEVVLTIAHGAEGEPDIISRIVEEAGSAGAAAVFFAFNDDRKRINPDVREYAEEIGLPLILIDFKQKFAEIQEKVNHAIWSLELEPYVRLQSDLFNAYFEGTSLNDAAGIISASIGVPAAIADLYGEILVQTEALESNATDIAIEINGIQFGTLKLGSDDDLQKKQEILKKYISFPLSLWFNQQRIEMMNDARAVNDFALRLAGGDLTEDIKREAGFLQIDLGKRYRAVIMEIVSDGPDQKMEFFRNTFEILQRAVKAGRQDNLTVICGAEKERFIVFVESSDVGGNIMTDHFIERWISDIRMLIPDLSVHLGVSRLFSGEDGFQSAYREALLSAAYCKDDNKPVYYEEARKIRIISAVMSQDVIRSDAGELLSRVMDYDKTGGSMELMKTLMIFIKTNYNTSETARQLCIHRQSLLSRLQKIEDLTGLSLKNHDDLFVLEVYSRLFNNF